MASCPICKTSAKPRGENASFPFCTPRCKLVDLGKWMNEEYRVPTTESGEDEETAEEASKRGVDVRN